MHGIRAGHRQSLWRRDPTRFLSIALPVSVLFWPVFEALYVTAPQCDSGSVEGVHRQVLFAALHAIAPRLP